MKTLFFVFFLCAGGARGQVHTDSVRVDGRYRTFHFNPPKTALKGRHLVFVLHGSGGHGREMAGPAATLEALSATEPLLAVYPDGYGRFWNECRRLATSAANREDVNEPAFFDSMSRYFARRYAVEGERFFAIGLSGGGHMAYKLALTMPRRCIAISAVVANLPAVENLDCEPAGHPVAVQVFNGTADAVNPYGGGEMQVAGSSFGRVRSADSTLAYWAGLAGYRGRPVSEVLPDPDPANGQTITRFVYRSPRRPEVILYRVEGGGHTFPKDVDAFAEAWAFFKRRLAQAF